MQITPEIIQSVEGSLGGWRRAAKGRAPHGTTWEDIQQDCYLAILGDDRFDETLGRIGPRINAIVKRVFIDACRAGAQLPLTNWVDGTPDDNTDFSRSSGGLPVEDDGPILVDAQDLLDSLSPEDRELLEGLRNEGLAPRDTALRRRQSRLRTRIKESL